MNLKEIFQDLISMDSVKELLQDVQKAIFEKAFDELQEAVERTATPLDNEALALFLEEAAKRIRETVPAPVETSGT